VCRIRIFSSFAFQGCEPTKSIVNDRTLSYRQQGIE
jgi:hypothetical protein